ncbi:MULTISPECIES: CidA/LrgA family holin-like protein [Aneurinibacillus]|uniref:Holin-like protein n=1 Tax=Aneurinibacillus thermoaerophilus TaxID=143495 RepID=A0A1G7ZFX8_ANETH|nr:MULTISPECIES: CidA/LrgA family holin-like protein [Aneurinibacillus]AMA73095.1 holin [Aneurinibacillus sp. XH2]MED0676547.1 CidA/LrgA family holin-like protein [Aneurinibacillus thermoaerophilus]MED0735954.1 CidA/LrgA family holin-like protein [Aneurinibacillus thermoaerophilus]MED0757090.1 CidA/LrgA family holin-like protein [Aneurinibacillus thermoaerophilus]MED0759389.1 CidA/LrgA family holin-like protein [Aneurinibacillus thermoaerophilus]
MTTLLKGAGQIALLCVFSLVMNKLVDFFHLKIPGSILGIFIIFTLLQTKIIRLEWVELGAKWLLAELLLFFIPSAVGIIKYKSVLVNDGVYVTMVIVFSTAIVMACTGLVAKKIAERKEQKPS